jgi:hypothetical protein
VAAVVCFLTGGRIGFADTRRGAGLAAFVVLATCFGALALAAALIGRFGADFFTLVAFAAL